MSTTIKLLLLLFLGLLALSIVGCRKKGRSRPAEEYRALREKMVRQQLQARGRDITDSRVLEAMRQVPRHQFVPAEYRAHAYEDRPLPIGLKQTISQPYIVAYMAQAAQIPASGARVLEIGTGSGYGAAVLSHLAQEVYTIEILEKLAQRSRETLRELGYKNVEVRHGDGYQGWPEKAPFDAIVVTAAPPEIPEPLKEQLKIGGRLVIPVGRHYQELVILTRTKTGFSRRSAFPVRFVPMTGKTQ